MCGIAGIINKQNLPISFDCIKEITDLVAHRGPDGEGFYLENSFAFGHRRLAIIDLSDNGKQPMNYAKRYTIVFNGAIYNYVELKEELQNFGYAFSSHTDTEVILAAYDKWGIDCLTRFNGMWAFAIYDKVKNEIICSRDRFGIKPFYYLSTKDVFVFGSEIKQCLPFLEEVKANVAVVMNYLVLNVTDNTSDTFFQGIKTLRGGHYLKYNLQTHDFSISRYYEISIKNTKQTFSEAKKSFLSQFRNSIKLRLRSDVNVGVSLSGGLDSSFIATIASKIYRQDTNKTLKAITAEAIDEECNEAHFAKSVSDTLDLEFHTTKPTTEEFLSDVDAIIELHEEPFNAPSIALQYYVMKKAKKAGVKVMLDGQGSDESLLGYVFHLGTIMNNLSYFEKIKFFISSPAKYGISYTNFIKTYFYFQNAAIRKKVTKTRIGNIRKDLLEKTDWHILDETEKKYACEKELQKHDLATLHIPQMLKWQDKNAMFFSIESRLPYLDWSFVENNLSLKLSHKTRHGWTKILIRESIKSILPESIVWRRKKFGYNAPMRSWFQNTDKMWETIDSSPFIKSLYDGNKVNIAKNDIDRMWRLYNIAVWAKKFKVENILAAVLLKQYVMPYLEMA